MSLIDPGGGENAVAEAVIGYLRITGLKVGLLLNFKKASLQVKRVMAPDNPRNP